MTAPRLPGPRRPIVVAGPNLAVDRTIEVAELVVGGVHRSIAAAAAGGGKGANVARALACMGRSATLIGFVGGRTGEAIRGMLADEGIACDPVTVAGESRSCLIVLAPGSVTVLNEAGPTPDAAAWQRHEAAVLARLEPAPVPVLVLSGSFPPGAAGDQAARLVAAGRRRGCTVVCDLSGAQLGGALAAAPDVVTPNLAEAEALLGHGGERAELVDSGRESAERAASAAVALLGRGARGALVTAGAAGAALARSGADGEVAVTELSAARVRVRNPVGAGDSLTAGVAAGLAAGCELEAAVRWGMAMAAASCETFCGGLLERDRAEALHAEIGLRRR